MNIPVPILIPTYNRYEITKKCIFNLLNGTFKDILIILCDSNSTDKTSELVELSDKIKYLNVGKDSWYSAAINKGVDFITQFNRSNFVLILNDDIETPSNLVEQLLIKTINKKNCIISPLQELGDLNFLGVVYKGYFKLPKIILNDDNKIIEKNVDSTNGSCLLVPIDVFNKKIYFNNLSCPHYYSDTEFQIRALKLGYQTVAFSDIKIVHGRPTNVLSKLNISNLFTFIGSPVLFKAYFKFGQTLFGNKYKFIFFGFYYHLNYLIHSSKAIKTLMKNQIK